jgi:hypothetical protein
MARQETGEEKSKASKISWDTWAVLAAFFVALLVRVGVIKQVPW